MLSRRTTVGHLLALTIAFTLLYGVGLDTHGVTNWQEGVRLLTARDMAERGDWVVPTIHGEPYLAKPPLIYWAQLTIAKLRGAAQPELFDLRLAVALAGVLGVLATYVAGLVLLAPRRSNPANTDEPGPMHTCESHTPRRAALWAACLAGTGVLFTRSARIGELDALLLPTVTGCVAAGAFVVLTPGRPAARTLATIAALVLAALAALTKGPAGLLVIACALPGGMLLNLCFGSESGSGPFRARARQFVLTLGVTLACAAAALGALYLWSQAVASSIGQDAVNQAVRTESGENLRFLDDDAWLRYLEALSYGAGLGSLLAVMAVGRLLRLRPPTRLPVTPGLWVVLGFLGFSFVAFSLTTKGVPRYLTPVWPSLALLGAWWLVQRVEETRDDKRQRPAEFSLVVIAALGVLQTVWYGYGREARYPQRSPRALARELIAMPDAAINPARLGAFDLWSPGLEIEFGSPVPPWAGPAYTADVPYAPPGDIAGLAERLCAEFTADPGAEPYTLFIRTVPDRGREEFGSATEQLEALGLSVTPIETQAEWRTDNGRTPVIPVHVRATPAG